jgi:hypothetical protein
MVLGASEIRRSFAALKDDNEKRATAIASAATSTSTATSTADSLQE